MRIQRQPLIGLFLTSAATLAFEFLLARLFSVSFGYHFAFIAISMAMFGLTAGAMIVFSSLQDQKKPRISLYAFLFSVSIILILFIYLFVPITRVKSFAGVSMLVGLYALVSIPFILSGIVVCLVFKKYPQDISYLYSVNLCGAAAGVMGLVFALKFVDCFSAVIGAALIACLGSVFFSINEDKRVLKKISLACGGLWLLLFCVNTIGTHDYPLLRLRWVKGKQESAPLYERWNTYSRITVREEGSRADLNWGPSSVIDYKAIKPERLLLQIDGDAGSFLTRFDGDLDSIDYLKYDLTNFVHYLRNDADVFIAGVGGGRDVLSALLFKQRNITAVDINEEIIDAVNKRFGDYTGHLDALFNVTFVADEARSFLTRSSSNFDIIQVALIDTWAATSAGAYALSENTLYTVEAWNVFLKHLQPEGVLTFSRWYYHDRPAEIYRLVSLASTSLRRSGIEDPKKHIVVVKNLFKPPVGLGTILIKKTPFSDAELDRIEEVADSLRFEVELSPRFAADKNYAGLVSRMDMDRVLRDYSLDITPPTDDRPFFFHMLRLKDVFNKHMRQQGFNTKNMDAVFILVVFLIVAIVLAIMLMLFPFLYAVRDGATHIPKRMSIIMACLGFGFMFIELSFMQRLTIFLGHPASSLSVILFTLLISCGIGSFLTGRVPQHQVRRAFFLRLGILLALLGLVGFGAKFVFAFFQSSSTWIRSMVAGCLIFPAGLFMGMGFPLALRMTGNDEEGQIIPWLWGVNGAASVCGSVIGTVISLFFGISFQYFLGVGFYFICFLLSRRE